MVFLTCSVHIPAMGKGKILNTTTLGNSVDQWSNDKTFSLAGLEIYQSVSLQHGHVE